MTHIYSEHCFNFLCHFAFSVRLWTDLTLCSVWSLFRFLSSSCFFFSILASRLVSSETTLLSMSFVSSTLCLTSTHKAWWQIQCHFIDKNRSYVRLTVRMNTHQNLLDGSSQGLFSLIDLQRSSNGRSSHFLLENKDSRITSCITWINATNVFLNRLH